MALYWRAIAATQAANPEEPAFLERDAEAQAEIGDAGIAAADVGVGHVIEEQRKAVARREAVAELDAFVKQRPRAQPLVVGVGAVVRAVMDRAGNMRRCGGRRPYRRSG